MDRLKIMAEYMPLNIKNAIYKLSDCDKNSVQEIRIRVNQSIHLTICGKEYALSENGNLSDNFKNGIIVDMVMLNDIFNSLCKHSLHSFEKTIKDGYITAEGGCRVGIGGVANVDIDNGEIISMQHISSLNIRIAKEVYNSALELYNNIYSKNENVNLLIAGKVNSGKTTLLQDLCRILSNQYRIVLIDERNEISAMFNGIPQNNIGEMTDILCQYPRHKGMEIALRTLSPQIIICDEISSFEDADAIEDIYGNGVNIIASTHADNINELKNKTSLKNILDKKIFNFIVFVDNNKNIGKIKKIIEL